MRFFKAKTLILTLFSLAFFFIGSARATSTSIGALSKALAAGLEKHSVWKDMAQHRVLLVNFVDLGQLHCTSRLGLLIPEQLRGFLQEAGWNIVEARRGLTLKIQQDTGQFILTDEVTDLAAKVNCSAVLVGTYLLHHGRLLVNARLIDVPGNGIVSSATTEAPLDHFMMGLLKPIGYGCKLPETMIKIKSFGAEEDEEGFEYQEENYEN